MILPCSFCKNPCSFEEDANECSCCLRCIEYQEDVLAGLHDLDDYDQYDDDEGGDAD